MKILKYYQIQICGILSHNKRFCSPRYLAKDFSNWRTVAMELSIEDYEILSNPDIWDSNLRIKDFVGRRYWHNKASTLSANERKSTVYQSWQV